MIPWHRLLAVALLLGLLFGAAVGFGSLPTNPDAGRYPGADAVEDRPATLVGGEVTVWGMVVATDPVIVRTEPGGEPFDITLTGDAVSDVAVGEYIGVHGTLDATRRVHVDRAFVTEPQERSYLYYISLLAGLWVLVRFLRGWQFEPATLTFRPRSEQSSDSQRE